MNNCQMVFHKGNCLNTKKPVAQDCRLCVEACPHEAIRGDFRLDAERCTSCGVCMAVCPSDGFVDRSMDKLYDYLFSADEVILNCNFAGAGGFEIACLGMLDRDLWATLTLLACSKPVRVVTGACGKCEERQACQTGLQTLKALQGDWPGHPEVAVEECRETASGQERTWVKQVSRRDFLTGWRQLLGEALKDRLPGLEADETYNLPRTRRWLIDALESQSGREIPFQFPVVEDSCTCCGVCSAVCPQGALQQRQEGEEFRLMLESVNCVQCGRCQEVCPARALTITPKWASIGTLTEQLLLHQGTPIYCSRCGKQIFHKTERSLCLACATDDRWLDY